MKPVIIVGGQTGVDRGAHKAAWDAGFQVSGYMPKGCRDEEGAIPPGIAKNLQECPFDGYPSRTIMNLESAHGLLILVENERDALKTPGTKQTWGFACLMHVSYWIRDQHGSPLEVWREIRRAGVTRLMVAGPRRSLWPEGEDVARRFIRTIGQL